MCRHGHLVLGGSTQYTLRRLRRVFPQHDEREDSCRVYRPGELLIRLEISRTAGLLKRFFPISLAAAAAALILGG